MPLTRAKRATLLTIAFGALALLLLLALSMGLRTEIRLDPVAAQVSTTRYLFLRLPVSSATRTLWLAPEQATITTPQQWHLMHEFHHSATGSKINHTSWGAAADTLMSWKTLDLDASVHDHLGRLAYELLNSDYDAHAMRVYTLRIDTYMRYQLQFPDQPVTSQSIDEFFVRALTTPIEP